jgi:hypothetical protein
MAFLPLPHAPQTVELHAQIGSCGATTMRLGTRSKSSTSILPLALTVLSFAISAGCGTPADEPGDDSGGTSASAGVQSAGAGMSGGAGKSAASGGMPGAAGTGGSVMGTGGAPVAGRGGGGGGPGATGGAGAGGTVGRGGRPGGAGAGGAGGAGAPMGGSTSLGGAGAGGAGGAVAGSGGAGNAGSGMGGGAGSGGGSAGAGSFDPCPTNGDPCKILPLGDSITFGIQYEGAWRVELFTKAVGDSKKITFVGSQMNGPSMAGGMTFPKNHEGHSGYTIDQMKPFAMTTDVPYMPNMILLHIGTNDTYGSSPSGAPARLKALTDLIFTTYPNALLVVAKIVPYPAQAANVKIINDSIPDLVSTAQAAGKHVLMADCFTGFMTSSMLSSDSIHPNQTGYNFMGDQFYSVISSYLH